MDEEFTYEAPGVVVEEICGRCPVQAWGYVDGQAFYFRARWSSWRVTVGGNLSGDGYSLPDDVHWSCSADYGEAPDAGWMSPGHARKCLDVAFSAYRARKPGEREWEVVGAPTGPEAEREE